MRWYEEAIGIDFLSLYLLPILCILQIIIMFAMVSGHTDEGVRIWIMGTELVPVDLSFSWTSDFLGRF